MPPACLLTFSLIIIILWFYIFSSLVYTYTYVLCTSHRLSLTVHTIYTWYTRKESNTVKVSYSGSFPTKDCSKKKRSPLLLSSRVHASVRKEYRNSSAKRLTVFIVATVDLRGNFAVLSRWTRQVVRGVSSRNPSSLFSMLPDESLLVVSGVSLAEP